MELDLYKIINNISSPIAVISPIKNDDKQIVDIELCFINQKMKKIAGHIFQDCNRWSEFKNNITADIPIFEITTAALTGNYVNESTYYSPATKRWYKVELTCITETDNEYIIATLSDITTEKNYARRLRESIIKDPLTGLLNRSGFTDSFEIILDTCRFEGKSAGILILDIDDLKNINDSLGPIEGDNTIIRVAEILKRFERDNINIFRYGDDEFLVLISNADSKDSIINITDTIYECFQQKRLLISGGVALYPDHSESKDELIRFADMAVHYAKSHGKNAIRYFEPEMQRVFIQQLTLQTKLTTAVLESSFYMNYQPQFDIRTGLLRGFEALLRWNDPELGEIGPSVFIPIAEETGLILPIGRWVLNATMSKLKEWQLKYNFKGIMSVNVSPIQLKQDDFLEELGFVVEKYQIDPASVEIEITEGVMINNIENTVEKLKGIKDMGFKISLDDFGTGYSSLNYLQALPLDTLKIDKSFINDITSIDGVQANITSSIITMVSRMGLETIAEGVEHPDQLNLLKRFNCNIVQGFLRGKPMSVSICENYLSGNTSAIPTN